MKLLSLYKKILCCSVVLLSSFMAWSQDDQVYKTVDTTTIKIGEQIQYTIDVVTDTTAVVTFPEGQTFNPLEVVEAQPIDTTLEGLKRKYTRIYLLTQFDSGSYQIPQQKVLINSKSFLLDSLRIHVADVAVDTTKQKLYDIKPLVEVEKASSDFLKYIWWLLIPLLLIAFLLYWFVLRKKPLTESEKIKLLPPFDRAILELKNLENSRYLLESKHKEYYSELTTIVKAYLEEEVHISALESTTDELIEKIELLQDSGNLKLERATIDNFKKVLRTSDLVKFAKMKPQDDVAESDRRLIEDVVVKTKEALPEPTEEDLAETEEYKEQLLKKRKTKRLIIGIVASLAVLIIAAIAATVYFGFNYTKDTLLGHPTKELLEEDNWVASDYGVPAIHLETPKVLKRLETKLPEAMDTIVQENHTFGYGSLLDMFYISVSTTSLKQGYQADANLILKAKEDFLANSGGKNMFIKQDEFTTNDGISGVKIHGSGNFPVAEGAEATAKMNFVILSFISQSSDQTITLIWKDGDTYAEKIVERIESSIALKPTL